MYTLDGVGVVLVQCVIALDETGYILGYTTVHDGSMARIADLVLTYRDLGYRTRVESGYGRRI